MKWKFPQHAPRCGALAARDRNSTRPGPRRAWLRGLLTSLVVAGLAGAFNPTHAAAPRNLLVLGDSLSAGYGLPRDSGWVRHLSDRLTQSGFDYNVVNASISGETTSGGRTRLPALLRQHAPAIVLIELGANDGLRGLDLQAMEDNLGAMIAASQKAGAKVLLVGMQLPPNYGRTYTERFKAVYPALAKRFRVALAEFLLRGLESTDKWFQADRIHPTVAAQPILLDNVWPRLQPLLGKSR